MKQKKEKKKEKNQRKRKKQNERIIKDKIIRDIRTFEQQQEEDYHQPKRVSSFWNNNYIEYESNGEKNKNLSLDEHFNKFNGKFSLQLQLTLFFQKTLKKSV